MNLDRLRAQREQTPRIPHLRRCVWCGAGFTSRKLDEGICGGCDRGHAHPQYPLRYILKGMARTLKGKVNNG